MASKLSGDTLESLPVEVSRPQYDWRSLTPGIVHVGVGNFHRAHMGIYLDRLHAKNGHLDWGIVGAGVRPGDAVMRERLAEQDWLTTVVELDPEAFSARVSAPMCGFAEVAPSTTIATLTDPRIRIVSLTVTEGGYYVASDGHFDPEHPDIEADAAPDAEPRTVFGMLLAALKSRRKAGHAPFTILSCDNLPASGEVTRDAVAGLALLRGEEDLLDSVSFPNGMVDCITPATTDEVRAMVAERFGVDDAAPVICEPFRQWVLEDDFPQGRPPLEEVGVEFVSDVVPYELMKLRVLNAGHAALAYPSAMLGYKLAHAAMRDDDVVAWIRALITREAIPTLTPIAGVDFITYLETCIRRFGNEAVGDTIARLCLDGSNRQPKFVLPTLRDRLEAGAPIEGLALEIALWRGYCAGGGAPGAPVIEDERADQLRAAAQGAPETFLELEDVFGDLRQNDRLSSALSTAAAQIEAEGVRGAIRTYAAS
jgi:mannitol 2-dehydrogenase